MTGAGGNMYGYDDNGNQVMRVIGGSTYTLGYDAENRLVSVSGPGLSAQFIYDGDGRRVMSVINGVTTTFVGNHYEVTGGAVIKYYYAGGSRVAMRQNGTLYYLLSDHLGSTSLTTDANGVKVGGLRYNAWGAVRYADGSTPTKYTYTGQYSYMGEFGLMFFNARWLDPALGRFAQADSIVPGVGNPQAWDRYAYSLNSPVRYSDPSGHVPKEDKAEDNWNFFYWTRQRAIEKAQKTGYFPDWLKKLVAIAIFSETSNATQPDFVLTTIGWVFLNRIAANLNYPGSYDGSFGGQTGTGFPEFGALLTAASSPLFKEFGYTGSFNSYSELIRFAYEAWGNATNGKFAISYFTALKAAGKALEFPTSDVVWFSHATTNRGGFPSVAARHKWVRDTVALRANADPTFMAIIIGPFNDQGNWVLFIASNYAACGFYSQCGPPWPRNTP